MPADLTITIQGTDKVLAAYAAVRGQLPYAQMIALNRTAEDLLAGARHQVRAAFQVRAPQFILPPQLLPKEWRATKDHLQARVQLGDGGAKKLGERRRAILEPFEEGKAKTFNQYGPVAIPTTYLRPTRGNLIDAKLYPRNLLGVFLRTGDFAFLGRKARVSTRTSKKTGAVRGQQVGRYFVLGQSGDRAWGVYERQSPTRIRKLWNYRSIVRRPPILAFTATMDRLFAERWQPNYLGALDVALRTAR
jgi:hypothetical protein